MSRSSLLIHAATQVIWLIPLSANCHGDELATADLAIEIEVVRSELELLRLEMGRPKSNQPAIEVSDAAPRAVYFQALTLLQKTNRLSFERVRKRRPHPKLPAVPIQATHIHDLVAEVLEIIRELKQHLGVVERVPVPKKDPDNTSTDLFQAIVQANRQTNLLLNRRFAPSDVYQQVTVAISYCARLLSRFPNATRIPEAAPYIRKKQPADVFDRLVRCYQTIRTVEQRLGLQCLELKSKSSDQTTPSDVYDIASLVVSELAYLHSKLPEAAAVVEPFYPGQKLPSHVFQHVGILEKQLSILQDRVAREPDRLFGNED